MLIRRATHLLLLAGGCRSTLSEAELQGLLSPAAGAAERLQLEVEIESGSLAGTFEAVLIARPSPPAVRLQLLPPLGAAILDVAATPAGIAGVMYGDDAPRQWRGVAGDPPPGPLLFFGITLLEQHAALTRERVLAAYAGPPPRLQVRGCFPGVTVADAEVAGGHVVGRTFAYGPARWRDRLDADGGSIDAPGFRLQARVRAREVAAEIDDSVFAITGTQ